MGPRKHIWSIQKIISHIEDENLYIKKNIETYAKLNKEEFYLISLKARGYNDRRIAKLLNIPPIQIKEKLDHLKKKTGFKTDSDLLTFAPSFQ